MRKVHSLPVGALTVAVLLLSVIAYIGVSGVAGPTQSLALAQTQCGADQFCIWPEPNFQGIPAVGFVTAPDPGCANLQFPTRSAINNTNFNLILSENLCGETGGRAFFLDGGEQNANFPYVARSDSRCTIC
ncbi:MAG: peptidase inhibitor family I36 protein [Egibacteraceae bacterium]